MGCPYVPVFHAPEPRMDPYSRERRKVAREGGGQEGLVVKTFRLFALKKWGSLRERAPNCIPSWFLSLAPTWDICGYLCHPTSSARRI